MYYMAVNIGSFVSMLITPVVAAKYGYLHAFLCSAFGMVLGLISYTVFYPKIAKVATDAGLQKFSWIKAATVIFASILMIYIFGNILELSLIHI